jgi:hypothetical protein
MAAAGAGQNAGNACPHRAEAEQADADGHALGVAGSLIL